MVEQSALPRSLRLRQLLDVSGAAPAAGQILLWDAAQGRWVPSQVASAGLADGSVTTAKLANGAVTTAKIAAGAVTSVELATDAVTTAKVAAGAITEPKLAAGAATDTILGNRTVDQAALPALPTASPTSGSLTTWLGWLASRVRSVLGTPNWWDTVPISLQALATHKARHAVGGADVLTPADIAAVAKAGDAMNANATLEIPSSAAGSPFLRLFAAATQVGLSADAAVSSNTLPISLLVRGVERLKLDYNRLTVTVDSDFTGLPHSEATPAAGQALAAVTWTKLAFGTEARDVAGNYDPALSRFTAPTAGTYAIIGGYLIPSTGGTVRHILAVYKNGVETRRIADLQHTSEDGVAAGMTLLVLAAGDTVELFGYVSVAVTTNSSATFSNFTVRKVG